MITATFIYYHSKYMAIGKPIKGGGIELVNVRALVPWYKTQCFEGFAWWLKDDVFKTAALAALKENI